jgi:hypothetical protein
MKPLTMHKVTEMISPYKYYIASMVMLAAGLILISEAKTTAVPLCSNPHVLEKLKLLLSGQVSDQLYAVNKVTSIFDISQLETPTQSSRTCAAGVTIKGSELGTINYIISTPAPGSVELLAISTSIQ